jgi:lysyl-tRNA synthetase class 2
LGNIFQICKAFRNAEAIGRRHNPEFTILEYYTAGADYRHSLALTEDLFAHLIRVCKEKLLRGTQAAEERLARFLPPFRRLSMAGAFRKYAGLDLETLAPKEDLNSPEAAQWLTSAARAAGLPAADGDTWEEAFNRVFVDCVEPALPKDKPLALLDYPRGVRCLARDIPGTPWSERWELYVDGIETANCFTEETSAEKVSAYFREESALEGKGPCASRDRRGIPRSV